jgi:TRAP-type mannitol/chloroaromatic compound transport system permease large subunit
LLAIPFFTFMGAILSAAGSPKTCSIRSAAVRAGARRHVSAVIFVGAILGAITARCASVIAMGVISMTPMLKYGYSTRHTMG